MNVTYQRPSTSFDSPSNPMAWTAVPPSYAQTQQQAVYHAQQHALNAPLLPSRTFVPVHAYYPLYPAPQCLSAHSSPAQGFGAQHQVFFPPQTQAQSRHAFAIPYAVMPPPPPYVAHDQPLAFGYGQAEMYREERMRSQSHGRWQGPPQQQQQQQQQFGGVNGNGEAGIWNGDSLMSGVAADYDHPSFDRPPHRSISQDGRPATSTASAPSKKAASSSTTQLVEYDLISNVSTVPPPPSIEKSAVPLADLAVEMVWEACTLAVEAESSRSPATMASWARLTAKPPSLFNEVVEANGKLRHDSTTVFSGMRSPPRTPELYGAIGEGRGRKVSGASDEATSGFSSPSSSGPTTPAGIGAMEATSARKMKLAGLGFAPFGSDNKNESLFYDADVTMDPLRTRARSTSTNRGRPISTPAATPAFPAEPTPAFRQFVKQILTATLVSPEDLVLALYYVARIPSTSFIQTSKPDQRDNAGARASAVKAAPFKVLLGALMLANKTLQDNSYRNETFATVSGIPLKDVNDLEVFVFGALGFDVAVRDDVWQTWLSVVCRRAQTVGGDLGDEVAVASTLQRLVLAANRNLSCSAPPAVVDFTSFSPLQTALPSFADMDAAGPLPSPPCSVRGRFPTISQDSPFGFSSDKPAFPTSNSRSFPQEYRRVS